MNQTPHHLQELAGSLAGTFPGREDAPLVLALLRQLALGDPVTEPALAAAAARDAAQVTTTVERWPSVQRDDENRVIAFGGLSLAPTAHRFEVGGRELFTWCAWDTLFLPALLGRRVRVRSTCPVTSVVVRLDVMPDEIVAAEPADLGVSFPAQDAARVSDIIGSFCCHVHFLAGPHARYEWLNDSPAGIVLSLDDAFAVGRLATRDMHGQPKEEPV